MDSKLQSDLAKTAARIRGKLVGRPGRDPGKARQSVSLSAWPAEARELVAEVQRALTAWNASPEGRAFRSSIHQEGLAGIKRQFDALLSGPAFARTRDLVASVSIGDLSFPLKSISIGAAAQADLFVGGYGSAGYAVDLADLNDLDTMIKNSVVCFYEALSEGIEAGADIAVQAGLWNKTTSDMAGYYWGVEIEADDLGGLAGFGLASKEDSIDLNAVLIDITVGVADGVDGLEFWAQTHRIYNPVAQTTAGNMLLLTNLHCYNINSLTGHDEVYLTFVPDNGVKYNYPSWDYYAMTDDQSQPECNWAVGRSVWYENQVQVDAWDGNDHLAGWTITAGDFATSTTYKNVCTRDGSISNGWNEIQYELTAERVDLSQ
jgi:hypothetical protein